ncbi:MAG: hypothetical protein MUP82_02650 [Candidatus Marinimicrobia bacterium]|nr:hypothetical protein [Candidatus Neomarinimicrobiota bacterium]
MKKILIFVAVISTVFANDVLLKSIKDNIYIENGWEMVEGYGNGVVVLTKEIPNIPIKAVMVKQNINIKSDIIAEVVEDISNYKDFLKSAKAMDANLLYSDDTKLVGHQHLKLKYVNDRHYAFNMFRPYGTSERVDWELIPEANFNSLDESDSVNKDGVYVDIGFGSWNTKILDNGDTEVSYRLVIHPGGNVPKFAIDYINKVAIVALFDDAIKEALKRSKELS